MLIRQPVVAGQFYPNSAKKLSSTIQKFLNKVNIKNTSLGAVTRRGKPPKILIVPHAGYDYSGQVAAHAFRQIENYNFKHIVLLGVSHSAFFRGIAIDDSDFWQTPLGKIKISKNFIAKLTDKNIFVDKQAHQQEHSLEVQLPFLQEVLKNFQIIPILIGQASQKDLKLLAQKISDNLNNNTLLIISSDLSHYPKQKTAQIVDKKTTDAILTLKHKRFVNTLSQLKQTYPNVDTFACASQPIEVALLVAKNLKINKSKLLHLTNSGKITGDGNRVVGYASIAFYKSSSQSSVGATLAVARNDAAIPSEHKSHELSSQEQKFLLNYSRQVLETYTKTGKTPKERLNSKNLLRSKKRGIFITLKKHGQLRGCIGSFVANRTLLPTIAKTTIASAFHDPRFPPLTKQELKDIKIEISILSPLKKINSIKQIKMGKHGVYLKYVNCTGTFLPQVATETGWTKKEFLSQLCSQKMGLRSDCYLDPKTEIFIYTVQLFSE
ncbi:AmmeMemoRadiSam system protein B [Patescibacteria group bacterium]|nr:AmmeMemoRadiSam system protein B [Patescibacteria group bacterium]MCG2702222.1 AmmeMemoRadiSam system protein B [Candidatus Parcubacteria bacterium]MBU4390102.1 AmmeMemoRadiSam system protein B [Patescibacteria group bacterium]MBU4397548.1 AmmeMemoRadiSam system protein B [Patescibacteria group bacterium]MBU4431207.1 AmmeMemoRadiSam system protein B [Patescibacteria group bacterium]